MITKSFILISLLMNTEAFASQVAIRIPVLIEGTNKVYNVSEVNNKLKRIGLNIPEYITIEGEKDFDKLQKIGDQVESANLKDLYSVKRFGRVSSYQGKNVKYPLCYLKAPQLSLQKASRIAYEILINLTDNILSDQYSVWGDKFYDEDNFNTEDEDSLQALTKKYGKIKLNPGEVLIVATTSDSGDDDLAEILSLCKK